MGGVRKRKNRFHEGKKGFSQERNTRFPERKKISARNENKEKENDLVRKQLISEKKK